MKFEAQYDSMRDAPRVFRSKLSILPSSLIPRIGDDFCLEANPLASLVQCHTRLHTALLLQMGKFFIVFNSLENKFQLRFISYGEHAWLLTYLVLQIESLLKAVGVSVRCECPLAKQSR